MFLHELSKKICREWKAKIDGDQYEALVRQRFENCCPYCLCELVEATTVVEHLDGMNRHRVGLHIPGNVVVACRKCNGEKRRDDARTLLIIANSGWESFLSHDGTRCPEVCANCLYWRTIWPNNVERKSLLRMNLERIRDFRAQFSLLEGTMKALSEELPTVLSKLYADCQTFATTEIETMLLRF